MTPITVSLQFICCFYFPTQYSKGKMAILGSVHMFSDQYLDKEENAKVQVGLNASRNCRVVIVIGTLTELDTSPLQVTYP